MKKKYYAIRKGRKTGIFTTWNECKESISGYKGNEYRVFTSLEAAEAYLNESEVPMDAYIYIDGSYNAATDEYAGSCVVVTKDEVTSVSKKRKDEFRKHKQIAGEILGAELALEFCRDYDCVEIRYDYDAIGGWADNTCKARFPMAKEFKQKVAAARETTNITFSKVKAHIGSKYNEMADTAARQTLGIS